MQIVPRQYDPVFFKRELKKLDVKIQDLSEKIGVSVISTDEPQAGFDIDSNRIYFHRDQDDFGFLLFNHQGSWFKFSGGNIVTGGGSILGLSPGNSNNVVYDNGTKWVSGTANAANLVNKTTVQSISAVKTFTSGLKTSAQNGVQIDPYNTGVGNTGELRFYELAANGTNYNAFKSPDNLASSVTYTLPNSAPSSNGDSLVCTTAGVLSWTTISASVSIGDSVGSATEGSIFFAGSGGILAQDNTNLKYTDADDQLHAENVHVNGDFSNYDSTNPDMGFSQNSDKRGYGNDYISEKDLNYCTIGFNDNTVDGNIRTSAAGKLEFYTSGSYGEVVVGFKFRETNDGEFSFQHQPGGFDSWIDIATGNSENVGLNGLPVTQAYQTSMGAYPVRDSIFGGEIT
jgi:hypothetical protein